MSDSSGAQWNPAVAAQDGASLVVWQQEQEATGWDIIGGLLKPNGVSIIGPAIPISTAPGEQSAPAVASNGTEFLLAWRDVRSDVSHIYGARLDAAGSVKEPDGIPICLAPGGRGLPSVTASGTEFMVVWMDRRQAAISSLDIFGSRAAQDGRCWTRVGSRLAASLDRKTRPSWRREVQIT